ncbi:MAG: hypothetical protein J5J06_13340, partial [Phycisphaerae bacterium]|nr:hypothetical protein [Phycisphaerae bacterium]
SADKQHLEADAEGLYYVRNRWYSPTLGRFLTADPNATGLPLQERVTYHGRQQWLIARPLDPHRHLADGSNLYHFARSNPSNLSDPAGLLTYAGLGMWAGRAYAAYDMYDRASSLIQFARDLQSASDMRTLLLDLATVTVDVAGGKIFDAIQGAMNAIGPFYKSLRTRAMAKPKQNHHFIPRGGKEFGPKYDAILSKYGLSTADGWNQDLMHHLGGHPKAYFQYMLEQLAIADDLAQGDPQKLREYMAGVFQYVKDNPEMLMKEYWQ